MDLIVTTQKLGLPTPRSYARVSRVWKVESVTHLQSQKIQVVSCWCVKFPQIEEKTEKQQQHEDSKTHPQIQAQYQDFTTRALQCRIPST